MNELRAYWYRRLRESGFRDIEHRDGSLADRNRLAYALALGPVVRQANAEYYDDAAAYLAVAVFPTALEQRVWELHVDGMTVREIARRVGCTKDFVQRRVKKHREQARLSRLDPLGTTPGEGS